MKEALERELRQLHAEILTGLADPRRLLILYTLASGPRSAAELAAELDFEPSSVERHIKVMGQNGLVLASLLRGEIRYQVSDDRVLEALGLLSAVLRDSLYRRAEMAGRPVLN